MYNVNVLLDHSFQYSFVKEPTCPITAGTCLRKNTKDKMRMAEYSTLRLEMGLLSGGVMASRSLLWDLHREGKIMSDDPHFLE